MPVKTRGIQNKSTPAPGGATPKKRKSATEEKIKTPQSSPRKRGRKNANERVSTATSSTSTLSPASRSGTGTKTSRARVSRKKPNGKSTASSEIQQSSLSKGNGPDILQPCYDSDVEMPGYGGDESPPDDSDPSSFYQGLSAPLPLNQIDACYCGDEYCAPNMRQVRSS